jgi:hypothetical protein
VRLAKIEGNAMQIQISHILRDPQLKAIFEKAEREQGQEPIAIERKQPKPRLSGGAARRVRELEAA